MIFLWSQQRKFTGLQVFGLATIECQFDSVLPLSIVKFPVLCAEPYNATQCWPWAANSSIVIVHFAFLIPSDSASFDNSATEYSRQQKPNPFLPSWSFVQYLFFAFLQESLWRKEWEESELDRWEDYGYWTKKWRISQRWRRLREPVKY